MEKGGRAQALTTALTPAPAAPPAATPPPAGAASPAPPAATPPAAAPPPGAPGPAAVVFSDEMRVGLHGQGRRVWAPIGAKVEQVLQIVYRWTYLLLAVDPVGGRLWWTWVPNLRGVTLAPAVAAWRVAGVRALVWDGAPGHRHPDVRAAAPPLVALPPYSPARDPAERIFRELRREFEGVVYTDLDAKRAAIEAWLQCLAADPARVRSLTGWSWLVPQITEALQATA